MATATLNIENEDWVPDFSFGDHLRVVRRKKHRTQQEMADLLGVKKVTYAAWEAGIATPPYAEVVKVARRLHLLDRVPMWWTLGADEHPEMRLAGGAASASLGGGARSSTDRASDYGSEVGVFTRRARPTTRRYGRRSSDRPRHLAIAV